MGAAIVFFGWQVPEALEQATELAVAVLLVALGLLPFVKRAKKHSDARATLQRSFMAGIVHGLAGSAGIALLVLTTIHDTPSRIGYLLLFGAGTIAGMCALTFSVMVPVCAFLNKESIWLQRLHHGACAMSIALGVTMAAGVLIPS
jgi:nickel/cobalt exporter